MIDMLINMINSQMFQGGVGLAIAGSLVYLSKQFVVIFALFLYRKCSISISVDNNDSSFEELNKWLYKQDFITNTNIYHVNEIMLAKRKKDDDGYSYTKEEHDNYILNPGEGYHWAFIDGCLVILKYSMEKRESKAFGSHDYMRYDVRIFGRSTFKEELVDQMSKSKKLEISQNKVSPKILTYNEVKNVWKFLGDINPRSASTLVTKDNVHYKLIEDIKNFANQRSFYEERGIPFKRGYLLTGSPGTGKSSLIRVLAHETNRNIAPISLNNPMLTDESFREALFECPDDTLIVFEDVDAIFNKRNGSVETNVTFSGFLNALDGVASQEGNIVIMSTNHPEKLDPALIRPGRIDTIIELGDFSYSEVYEMLVIFFPDENLSVDFVKTVIGTNSINPAAFQEILMKNLNDFDGVMNELQTFGMWQFFGR